MVGEGRMGREGGREREREGERGRKRERGWVVCPKNIQKGVGQLPKNRN